MASGSKRLEVHEHHFISGPRANKSWLNRLEHSHEGGEIPHEHEDTGPASYTVDKDEWFRRTGLTGGGRKKFTARPSGDQLPIRELADWQKSFEIVVFNPPSIPEGFAGEGGAHHAAERMIQTFRMKPTLRVVSR